MPVWMPVWMPVGEQRSVAVPEQNGKFCLYGALDITSDITSGEVIVEPYAKGRSDPTNAFLRRVLSRIEGRILLIWDHASYASWHLSKTVQQLIDDHDRLEVMHLPRRAPEDNPVEDRWHRLKNVVAANLERSLEALRAACRRFFKELTPKQALKIAGLN